MYVNAGIELKDAVFAIKYQEYLQFAGINTEVLWILWTLANILTAAIYDGRSRRMLMSGEMT